MDRRDAAAGREAHGHERQHQQRSRRDHLSVSVAGSGGARKARHV
jgi:hypothetical protein